MYWMVVVVKGDKRCCYMIKQLYTYMSISMEKRGNKLVFIAFTYCGCIQKKKKKKQGVTSS